MSLLAQYPINDAALNPYIGRPVGAVLADGDVVPGVLHRVDNGHIILSPLNAPGAAIAGVKGKVRNHPGIEAAIRKLKANEPLVKTKAWGLGGYPFYGWGYGSFGWGAGWWWIWPLIFLAALFAFPFWW